MRPPPDLRSSLADLVTALRPVADGDGDAAALAGDVVTGLEEHTLPRLDHPEAPLVVAVSGLTGVGKSSLVNALLGAERCRVGPLRPTTTEPAQLTGPLRGGGPEAVTVTLLDLPPGPGYDLAPRADLHLFVTSPARYGDADGWDQLSRLTVMSVPTWIVLLQVGPEDGVVVADLEQRLAAAGLGLPLVTLGDLGTDPDAAAALAARVDEHAADPAVPPRRIAALLDAADEAARVVRRREAGTDELHTAVDAAYGPAETVAVELATPGGAVDGVAGAPDRPWEEVVDRLAVVLTHRIGIAAETAASRWSAHPDGARLLDGDGAELWRHGADTPTRAREQLLVWPGEVEGLVVSRLRPRRWWQRPVPPGDLAALVKRRALGGPDTASRRERRRLDGGVDQVSDEARGLLGRIALGIVDADKQRFVERLPDAEPSRVAEIERAADAARRALETAGVLRA